MQLQEGLKEKEQVIIELCKQVEVQKDQIANLQNDIAEYQREEPAPELTRGLPSSSLSNELAQAIGDDSETQDTVRN